MSLRPFCEKEECTATKCYNRHGTTRSTEYQLVLIVSRSHLNRIVEYLQNELVFYSDSSADQKIIYRYHIVATDLMPVSTAATKNIKKSTSARIYVRVMPTIDTKSINTASSSSSSSSSNTQNTKKQKVAHHTAIDLGNPATDLQRAIEVLFADVNLFRNLLRVYIVNGCVANEKLLYQKLQASLRRAALTHSIAQTNDSERIVLFRPRCFPRSLDVPLAQEMKSAMPTATLTSKECHVILCAMNIDDGILFGSYVHTTSIQQSQAKKISYQNTHCVSRASWKLVEVFRRRPFFHPSTFKFQRPFIAVDIGSSPGGWSYELAAMPNCGKVYSVDPGALTPPIPENVIHLPLKIEECSETFRSENVQFDIVVCDMNANPRMTVESVLSLMEFIADGAVVVLTFKNFVGGKKAFQKALNDALEVLDNHIVQRDVLRLMSGGIDERTVVGRWKKL